MTASQSTDQSTDSVNRSVGGLRQRSHERTDELTEREVQGRRDLSVRTARLTRGRHHPPRPAIPWWIWALVATGYAWLTWRMAVIELPTAAGLGAAFTTGIAFAAGHLAGRGA